MVGLFIVRTADTYAEIPGAATVLEGIAGIVVPT
jgi:hypothetical protein